MKLKPLGLSALLGLCLLNTATITAWSVQVEKAGQGKKAGQESCDGVLDVVPTKTMSFTRKRRSGKEASATAATVNSPANQATKTSRKKSNP
jgi:hypothetical protein